MKKRIRQKSTGIFPSLILFFCVLFLLLFETRSLSHTASENEITSLKEALRRSAIHCYATEGTYPENLSYIKEHYGISWNEEKYLVDYEITGANLMPDITVFAKHP